MKLPIPVPNHKTIPVTASDAKQSMPQNNTTKTKKQLKIPLKLI